VTKHATTPPEQSAPETTLTADTLQDTEQQHPEKSSGKGAPTPTRKEREAANRRPLVPNDRKEAARIRRHNTSEAREQARRGMAAGEERYLPTRDKGPQKRFVRDYIDARFNIGELLIPVMFAVLIMTFLPIFELQAYGIFTLWAFFFISIIDCVIVGFRVKKKLGEKFGISRVERGVRWYASMRALQLRLMRLPKPQVKRGQFPH
jgi:hypothetical protein